MWSCSDEDRRASRSVRRPQAFRYHNVQAMSRTQFRRHRMNPGLVHMRRHFAPLFLALIAGFSSAKPLPAQIPAKCFEIESILVDACTSSGLCPSVQEGQNEMVLFMTGPGPIRVGDLSIVWPNNSFRGLVRNATTASVTGLLNATITGCGHLLEPPGGVIPAGRRVLLITSTDLCVPANSFATLSDTLFVIFQDAGNTAGHFANHNNGPTATASPAGPPSTRALIMSHVPTGCGDTATYDRALLVNIFGTYGGTPAQNDGATARFSWPGTPVASYVNHGCQAPYVPLEVDILNGGTIACGGSITLSARVGGGHASLSWSGGTGVFSAPNDTVTGYTAGAGDNGPVTLRFCATDACQQVVCDSVAIIVSGGGPVASITASGPLALCTGSTVRLTASGGTGYLWTTGATTDTITVGRAGTYEVAVSNGCGSDTARVTVTESPPPIASIGGNTVICSGEVTVLTASGGGAYLWNTGAATASITVGAAGTYAVSVSNGCGTAQASVSVGVSQPAITATASPLNGTAPLTVVFGASSNPLATAWLWDFDDGNTAGSASATNVFSSPGLYTVRVTGTDANGCTGTSTILIEVTGHRTPSSVVVPNVFSPNGDGRNDAFRVVSEGLSSLNVEICDRWGTLVAVIDHPDKEWDGRAANGGHASEGTYFYRLLASGLDGRSYELIGSLTLLR